MRLRRQVPGQRFVQLTTGRGQHEDPARLEPIRIGGADRGVDRVHAQDHSGSAAVGRVVYLTAPQRCRVTVVEEPQLVPATESVPDVAL
jgi:hypothetical protein